MNDFNWPNIIFPSGDVTQPWQWWYQFAPITINQMKTPDPNKELKIVKEAASYGRQLGRIIEVVEVLAEQVPVSKLTDEQKKAVTDFQEMSREIRAVKDGYQSPSRKNIDRMAEALEYWKENDPDFFEEAREKLAKLIK